MIVVIRPLRSTAKIRFGATALMALKPDLVPVSITGFGLTDKRANLARYNLNAEG